MTELQGWILIGLVVVGEFFQLYVLEEMAGRLRAIEQWTHQSFKELLRLK